MDNTFEEKKPQLVRYFTSTTINGKKHHFIVTYDKSLGTTTKPQDYIFNKADLKKWI